MMRAGPRQQVRDNAIVLAVLVVAPRLGFVQESYWSMLAVLYRWIGNDLDVFVHSTLHWLGALAYIICGANILVSLLAWSTKSPSPRPTQTSSRLFGTVKSSPKTRPAASLPGPISPGKRGFSPASPARSTQESPLRNAIAAARNAGTRDQSVGGASPGRSSTLQSAPERRSHGLGQAHPSGSLTQGPRKVTPLDVYKARHPNGSWSRSGG